MPKDLFDYFFSPIKNDDIAKYLLSKKDKRTDESRFKKPATVEEVLKKRIPVEDKERILKNTGLVPDDTEVVRKLGEDFVDSQEYRKAKKEEAEGLKQKEKQARTEAQQKAEAQKTAEWRSAFMENADPREVEKRKNEGYKDNKAEFAKNRVKVKEAEKRAEEAKKSRQDAEYDSLTPGQKIASDIPRVASKGLKGATSSVIDLQKAGLVQEPRSEIGKKAGVVADTAGAIGGALTVGGPVMKAVDKGTRKALNYATRQALGRASANVVTSGTRNLVDFMNGEKSLNDVFIDTGLGVVSSAVSVFPEHLVKAGLANVLAQYGTDIGTEVLFDFGSGRVDLDKLRKDPDYLLKYTTDKLKNNAVGIVFGAADNATKRAREELGQRQAQFKGDMKDTANKLAETPTGQKVLDKINEKSSMFAVDPKDGASGKTVQEEKTPETKIDTVKRNEIAVMPKIFQESRKGELKAGRLDEETGAEKDRVEGYLEDGGFDIKRMDPIEVAVFKTDIKKDLEGNDINIPAGQKVLISGHNRMDMMTRSNFDDIPANKIKVKEYDNLKDAVIDSIKSNIDNKVTTYDYNLINLLRKKMIQENDLIHIFGGSKRRKEQILSVKNLFDKLPPDVWDRTLASMATLHGVKEGLVQRKLATFEKLGDTIKSKPFYLEDPILAKKLKAKVESFIDVNTDASIKSLEDMIQQMKAKADKERAIADQDNLFGDIDIVTKGKDTATISGRSKRLLETVAKIDSARSNPNAQKRAERVKQAVAILDDDGPEIQGALRRIRDEKITDPDIITDMLIENKDPWKFSTHEEKTEMEIKKLRNHLTSIFGDDILRSERQSKEVRDSEVTKTLSSIEKGKVFDAHNDVTAAKAVADIMQLKTLNPAEKDALCKFVLVDKNGFATETLVEGEKRKLKPLFAGDIDHFKMLASANSYFADTFKTLCHEILGVIADKHGLPRNRISVPSGDEIFISWAEAKEMPKIDAVVKDYQAFLQSLPPMKVILVDPDPKKNGYMNLESTVREKGARIVPADSEDMFGGYKVVAGEKAPKMDIWISPDKTYAIFKNISLSGAVGQNIEDAAEALHIEKNKGRASINLEGKAQPQPTLRENTTPDFKDESETHPYSLETLLSWAGKAVHPNTLKRLVPDHILNMLSDYNTLETRDDIRMAVLEAKLIDQVTKNAANAEAWNGLGMTSREQDVFDLAGLKLINDLTNYTYANKILKKISNDFIEEVQNEYQSLRGNDPGTQGRDSLLFRRQRASHEQGMEKDKSASIGKDNTKAPGSETGSDDYRYDPSGNKSDLYSQWNKRVDGRVNNSGSKGDRGNPIQADLFDSFEKAGISNSGKSLDEIVFYARIKSGKFGLVWNDNFLRDNGLEINPDGLREILKRVSNQVISKDRIIIKIKESPKEAADYDKFISGFDELKTVNGNILHHPNAQEVLKYYGIKPEYFDYANKQGITVLLNDDGTISLTDFPIFHGRGANEKEAMNAMRAHEKEVANGAGARAQAPIEKKPVTPPEPGDEINLPIRNEFENLPDDIRQNMILRDMKNRQVSAGKSIDDAFDKGDRFETLSPEEADWFRVGGEGAKNWLDEAIKNNSRKASAESIFSKFAERVKRMFQKDTVPEFWYKAEDSGERLIGNWLGSKDVAAREAEVMQKKLEEELGAILKRIDEKAIAGNSRDRAALNMARFWNKQDYAAREMLAGMAVHIYMDTVRKEGGIKYIRDNFDKMDLSMKFAAYMSTRLPPEMKAYADKISGFYDNLWKMANEGGLHIAKSPDFVNRLYEFKDSKSDRLYEAMGNFGKFKTSSQHEKARKFNSMLEIYQTGGRIKMTGAAEALAMYMKDITDVMYNKKFILFGETIVDPRTGTSLFITKKPGGYYRPPEGYTAINSDYFSDNGRTIFAPKEIARHIENICKPSILREIPLFYSILKFNWALKNLILSKSLFHYINLTTGYLFGSPKNGVMRFKSPRQAAKIGHELLEALNPVIMLGIKQGLQVKGRQHEPMQKARSRVGGKKPYESMREYDQFDLFVNYGDGLKIISYYNHYMSLAKRHPDMDPEDIASEAAKVTNDDFGGLDYRRFKHLSNKALTDALSLVAFAPDWQLGNMRSFFKNFVKGTGGEEYRRFWARAIPSIIVSANVVNMILNGGRTTFENIDPKEERNYEKLEKWNERTAFDNIMKIVRNTSRTLYKSARIDVTNLNPFRDKNDPNRYYYDGMVWMGEGLELLRDPARFFKNKASVLARAIQTFISGKDYRNRPFTGVNELVHTGRLVKRSEYEKPQEEFWDQSISQTLYQVQSILPILMASPIAWATGTIDAFEMLTQMAGIKIKKSRPPQEDPFAMRNAARALKRIPKDERTRIIQKARREVIGGAEDETLMNMLFFPKQKIEEYDREKRKKDKMERIRKKLEGAR